MTVFNPEDRALVKAFVALVYVTVSEYIRTVSEDLLLSGLVLRFLSFPPEHVTGGWSFSPS